MFELKLWPREYERKDREREREKEKLECSLVKGVISARTDRRQRNTISLAVTTSTEVHFYSRAGALLRFESQNTANRFPVNEPG